MNKGKAFISIIVGVVLMRLTHSGILNGRIVTGKAGNINEVLLDDPGFWFAAGLEYAFGFYVIILGVIYAFTGYRYLPEIEGLVPERPMLILSLLSIFLLALALKFILPIFYV